MRIKITVMNNTCRGKITEWTVISLALLPQTAFLYYTYAHVN